MRRAIVITLLVLSFLVFARSVGQSGYSTFNPTQEYIMTDYLTLMAEGTDYYSLFKTVRPQSTATITPVGFTGEEAFQTAVAKLRTAVAPTPFPTAEFTTTIAVYPEPLEEAYPQPQTITADEKRHVTCIVIPWISDGELKKRELCFPNRQK